MADRYGQLDALALRELGCASVEAQPRGLIATAENLDLVQPQAPDPEALQGRLLGGEPGGEMASRAAPVGGGLDLGRGEDTLAQAGTALERALEALDLDQVDTDPRGGLHAAEANGPPGGPPSLARSLRERDGHPGDRELVVDPGACRERLEG